MHHQTSHHGRGTRNGHVIHLVEELHREDERMNCGYLSQASHQIEYGLLELAVDEHRGRKKKCQEGLGHAAEVLFLLLLLPLPPDRHGRHR